ncbi:hypothetical protein LCGC14_3135180 [marine sediment metagenome]|uniref:Uncharacterized protein n=1 Tax=marine sediment metagenome TaxID=412755 RepID=A0A0F8VYL0_9ZZZZ
MKYCYRKGGKVSDHRCNTSKHPECIQTKRFGFCQYAERYVPQCGHTDCTDLQGRNLSKMISGRYMIAANGGLIDLGRRSKNVKLKPRNADRLRKPLRVNKVTRAGNVDLRRNWRKYRSQAAYMLAGREHVQL